MQEDKWVWGNEKIVWGFSPDHQYTLKILQPKVGKEGCLSLQYHHEKSESWIVLAGEAWGLFVLEDRVVTKIMKKGDIRNIPAGTIHRMMGLSRDVEVVEASTPDAHAADKSMPKDVVRLHCVFGRDVEEVTDPKVSQLVQRSVQITEEAISCLESGRPIPEYS